MSRQELERLVGDAEASASIREQLERCSSRDELVLLARRLGYRLTGKDLQRAWWEDSLERRVRGDADARSPVARIRHPL